jgi:hypothetical protein
MSHYLGLNMTIQSDAEDKVVTRIVTNTSTFFTRHIGLKMLGLEIKEDISILRIGRDDEEYIFIRERIYGLSIFISMGKIADELRKHQGFFSFGLSKLDIEFLKDEDPFGIFSPKKLTC